MKKSIPDSTQTNQMRLSSLLSDTRYRGRTLQVIFACLIISFGFWLVNNTLQNLIDLGKPLSFSFLSDRAGYDINQRLITYSPDDSHLQAGITGLLNTLIVAIFGCILATIIGLFVGMARLSKSPGLARLARIYVEIFRNVPLLLWLLLTFALISEALPAPNQFRGENPQATMWLGESVAFTNRGVYIPSVSFLIDGAIWVFISSILIAGFSSWVMMHFASVRQKRTGRRINATLPILCCWLILAFFAINYSIPVVEYPVLRGFNFQGGLQVRSSLIALWLALALYTASFIAEIVRSGILAVDNGQREAAAALGLPGSQSMRLVILPQALKVIIPPLISNYLNLTKNSSLAIAVGYMDLTGTLMGITMNQTGRELEAVLIGMSVYLTISITISLILNWFNARNDLVER